MTDTRLLGGAGSRAGFENRYHTLEETRCGALGPPEGKQSPEGSKGVDMATCPF